MYLPFEFINWTLLSLSLINIEGNTACVSLHLPLAYRENIISVTVSDYACSYQVNSTNKEQCIM